MRIFIILAIRNVYKNYRSTLLNSVGITICAIITLFIFSLSNGIESQIITRSINYESGAVSISLDKKIGSTQNKSSGDSLLYKLENLFNNDNRISKYSYRIIINNAFLYYNDNSQAINITGIGEDEISLVTDMYTMIKGRGDSIQNKNIVISNGLAELYNIGIGDNCNIMLQSIDGSINFDEYVVIGIFRNTSNMNKFIIYMNYNESKILYNTNLPTNILISLDNIDNTKDVKKTILKDLGYNNLAQVEGEIKFNHINISSYQDHLGFAKSIASFNKYGMLGVASFLILISFVGIWSMQVENINERKKEVGALLSFGFDRCSVKTIFIYETLFISFVSFIICILFSSIAITLINLNNGLYLGDSASFIFGTAIVNPELHFLDIFLVLVIVTIYPLIASVFSLSAIHKTQIINLLNDK